MSPTYPINVKEWCTIKDTSLFILSCREYPPLGISFLSLSPSLFLSLPLSPSPFIFSLQGTDLSVGGLPWDCNHVFGLFADPSWLKITENGRYRPLKMSAFAHPFFGVKQTFKKWLLRQCDWTEIYKYDIRQLSPIFYWFLKIFFCKKLIKIISGI